MKEVQPKDVIEYNLRCFAERIRALSITNPDKALRIMSGAMSQSEKTGEEAKRNLARRGITLKPREV